MSPGTNAGEPGDPEPPVRTLREPCAGPAAVSVEIDAGRIEIRLAPEAGPETEPETSTTGDDNAVPVPDDPARPGEIRVQVSADPASAPGWLEGVAGVLGWLEQRIGTGSPPPTDARERAERAVAAVEIAWKDGALTVRHPAEPSLRAVPLLVTVWAPDSSALRLSAGAAPVSVAGRCGTLDLATTGEIRLDELGDHADLRCGAGNVAVRRSTSRLRIRAGAGRIDADTVLGPAEITSGAATVRLGSVAADVAVRCGSGDVTVDEVAAGDLELSTGAGSLHVGVRSGVDARVDLRATAGRATSDLPVSAAPPSGEVPVRIRGRAAAGDARVVGAGA